jgi:hypothetical protein
MSYSIFKGDASLLASLLAKHAFLVSKTPVKHALLVSVTVAKSSFSDQF